MTPYYSDDLVTIYHGDCREVMSHLEPASVTMLWTDPPYGHENAGGDDWLSKRHEIMGDGRATTHEPIANDSPELMREVVDVDALYARTIRAERFIGGITPDEWATIDKAREYARLTEGSEAP